MIVNATETENRIVSHLIDTLLADKYTLGVNDGEETPLTNSNDKAAIEAALATTDLDRLLVYKDGQRFGVVLLVWGNDEDVITDCGGSGEALDYLDRVTREASEA